VQAGEREGKGTKGSERVVGKAAGDECVFISGEGLGLADEVGSDAILDAAGGEGGHGAAKPHGVIHRYRVYRNKKWRAVRGQCFAKLDLASRGLFQCGFRKRGKGASTFVHTHHVSNHVLVQSVVFSDCS
jgi:hypothetical protein